MVQQCYVRSQYVHKKIGEMLAVDCQPLKTLVSKEHCSLATSAQVVSINYTDTIMPKNYTGMKDKV